MHTLFAVSPPGLEEITRTEMRTLGLIEEAETPGQAETPQPSQTEPGSGGIEFNGDLAALYRANLHLRTAGRILLRLSTFYATSFEQLFTNASRLPWERYLNPGNPAALRVTCHQSRLYHSDAVGREVLRAVESRLGLPVPAGAWEEAAGEMPAQGIVVRLHKNRCTVSIDSSGENLHRRGYRLAGAKAPLRENLAAAMILASGWDGKSPFLDPFCGSGTLPIEAALLAAGMAPGRNRRFAFQNWPGFDPALWQTCLDEADAAVGSALPPIQGSDRDAGAVEAAQANARRAGVADRIEFSCRAVSAIEAAGKGWVVTNPPYGVRISGNQDLRNLYAQFGNVLHSRCAGWQVAVLCSDEGLLRQTRLSFKRGFWITNGGIKVKLACGQV